MSGIDNIIQKINEDNQQKIKEINEKAAIQIDEIKTLEDKKAQDAIKELEDNIKKQISEVERNAVSAAQMKNRQELLKTRQDLLYKVFEDAKKQMFGMDDAKRTSYVKTMVLSSASGTEKLIASKKDSIFTQTLLDELNKELIAKGKEGRLAYELTDEDVNGIILKKDGMLINLTYEAVISEMKNEIDTQVAKILFEI